MKSKPRCLQKPAWFAFADEVRERLARLPPQKGLKRYDRAVYNSWLKAQGDYGYPGSPKEWDFFLHDLGRINQISVVGYFEILFA